MAQVNAEENYLVKKVKEHVKNKKWFEILDLIEIHGSVEKIGLNTQMSVTFCFSQMTGLYFYYHNDLFN